MELFHQRCVEWNDTSLAPPPPASTVVAWFRRQAATSPGAPALRGPGTSWSYRELDTSTSRLARFLRRRGAGRGRRVGLFLERDPAAVAALLGVAKSGAAYVALDPSEPPERLASMLAATRPGIVLTSARLAASLPAAEPAPELVRLDADAPLFARQSGAAPGWEVEPGDPAYVIFTSGSSGRPKAIVLAHRPLLNLIAWHLDGSRALFGRRLAGARTLQLAPLGFDASFHEIFATWCSGGCLVTASATERRDPAALADLLRREKIEKAILPVVLLHEVAEECLRRGGLPRGGLPHGLRELLVTGEQLHTTPAAAELCRRLPALRIHNHYGPSETHVVTACTLAPKPEEWPTRPPIGRPIADTSLYVLDPELRLAAPGRGGELYVGGVSLAQGYLGRPALTAERFLPDPFAESPGARLYRTGDLGRHLDDGNLLYLGRVDDQVKIRGFRVEPAEVEAALERHPAVRQSAVVAVGEGPDRRLAGFLVARGPAPAGAELRAHLARWLPEPMIPASFTVVDRLPRTANGKLDRAALAGRPLPAGEASPGTPPKAGTEEALARVWCEVLGRPAIRREDDFFGLGGHSISAARVCARLREAGVELDVAAVFAHPTLAELAAAFRQAQPAPAPSRADRQGGPSPQPSPPPNVSEKAKQRAGGEGVRAGRGFAPLSFAQQRLWFLHQLDPSSAAYNLAYAWRLDGSLDCGALERACAGIVRRHAVLRATFSAAGGEPRQLVAANATVELTRIDLTAVPHGERETAARRLLARTAARPFDLERGPLLRFALARLGEHRHVFFLGLHHIAFDAWSLEVFCRELAALYAGSSLPELDVQYADFAVWQRERKTRDRDAALAWWREELRGLPEVALAGDRPPAAARSGRGRTLAVEIDAGLAGRLRRLCLAAAASPFMTLLAAFAALAARTGGRGEVAVGAPLAHRPLPRYEGLVGLFLNTVVLRADLRGDPSFRVLLERIRATVLRAFAHQDAPFDRVVRELRTDRGTARRSPLFQVLFAFEAEAQRVPRLPGLAARRVEIERRAAELDLVLSLREEDGSWRGFFGFSTEIFDVTTIARLRHRFHRLLADAAAAPDRPLSEAAWLTAGERHQLLSEWNDTGPPSARAPLFQVLFESWAAATPGAPAVVDSTSGRELSYGELNHRANELAGELGRRGVGPEVGVAVLMEPSAERVAALVAVWKAGGFYVPLDPAAPPERWSTVLGDCGARLVVADRHLPRRAPRLPPALVVEARRSQADAAAVNPPVRADARNTAYLIYTSGSTGRPKGVAVAQGSLAWLCTAGSETFRLVPGDRFLHVSSIAFDLSVVEVFVPLARGAATVVAERSAAVDAAALFALCRRLSVTIAGFVAWREMVREATARPASFPPSLRLVCTGADRLPPETLAPWWRTFGRRAELRNMYGPTEATVEVTNHVLHPAGRADAEVPVGRPRGRVRLHVLDRALRLAAAGELGELCLSGACLARGYAGRPAATAERFVPHPYAETPGERLLRTGDQARHRAGGEVELAGRYDRMVKVRGFRVEPGEVEAALAAHPEVAEAAVVAHETGLRPGDRRLAAYVVAARGDAPPPRLRGHLQARLPGYMVPSSFVFLDRLPLTPSGKLDRRALPAPESGRRELTGSFAAPRDELERTLAAVWGETLGLSEVGVDDNFFDLGGHSLLLVEVRDRLRRHLGRELPIVELFRHPTLESLARHLGGSAAAGHGGATRRLGRRARLEDARRTRREHRAKARERSDDR